MQRVARDFVSLSVSEEETIQTIADVYKKEDYLLDPHTAVGIRAARELGDRDPTGNLSVHRPSGQVRRGREKGHW